MRQDELPDDLIEAFCQGRAVFFMSAGCSVASGIPSAASLAESILKSHHARSGSGASLEEFAQETYGSSEPTLDEVAEFFFRRDEGRLDGFIELSPFAQWNLPAGGAQRAVARLAREEFFSDIFTTNWDELIEAAAREMRSSLVRIRSVEDLGQDENVDVRLYKIHGCLTDTKSIIAATSQLEEALTAFPT